MAEQPKRPNRILIVEDEGIVATDIEKCLEDYGYEVTGIAASSDEALDQAGQSRPDLVLMDIRIQGERDGIEAAGLLRRRFDVPVIYLTAHGDKDTAQRAKITEPVGFLLKPFKEVELANAVEIALHRVNVEKGLREREQWLVTALGSIGDAVLSLDEYGNVRFMNPAAETLTAWTSQEGLGQPLTELVRVVQGPCEGVFGNLLDTGSQPETECRIMLRDGSLRWVTARGTGMSGAYGRAIRILVLQDITGRKEAEETLRRQADLLDQSHDAILTWKLSGEITYWNRGAEILYGYTRREALGSVVHELLQTVHGDGIAQALSALQQSGQWSGELTHTTRDGRNIVVESLMVMVSVKEPGERTTVLATNRDITERKRVEEEIRRLNDQLEQRVRQRTGQLEAANQEMESFSYSVSHDLRAPLRAVDGFSKILLRDYCGRLLDETAIDYLRRMSASTQRMGQLIADLLALSRLSRQEMTRRSVNLSAIAGGILAEYRAREPQRQVNIQVQPELIADADPHLARVALENLLANAWKYTGKTAAATVAFGAFANGKTPTFFVRDNGAGFDMAHADQLFAPFQRLHRSDEFEGNGIGLATVQRVIRRHGGRIWAEAEPGRGAVFYFTLGEA